jgi:hypothetical protein
VAEGQIDDLFDTRPRYIDCESWLELHRHCDFVTRKSSTNHEAGLCEEIEHLVILGKRFGEKPLDAYCYGRIGQNVEER